MDRRFNVSGKLAVAAGAAIALSFSGSRIALCQQDAAKVQVKTEGKKVEAPPLPTEAAFKELAERRRMLQATAIVPLNGPAEAANVEQAARQAIQQVRPIFQTELRLLTSSVEPTPDQRREIALEAGRTLKLSIRSMAANNASVLNGRTAALIPDPRKLVRQHLEVASWSKLSNLQSARYRNELELKAQDRREVVVLNIVANLDKHLRLDAAQREKLCESLRSHWDDRDFPSLEPSVTYDTYVPTIPDNYIVPILSDDQTKVWRGLRKYHFSSVRTLNPLISQLRLGVGEIEVDDDVLEALKEGPKE